MWWENKYRSFAAEWNKTNTEVDRLKEIVWEINSELFDSDSSEEDMLERVKSLRTLLNESISTFTSISSKLDYILMFDSKGKKRIAKG